MKYKIPDILVLLLIKVMPGSYTADCLALYLFTVKSYYKEIMVCGVSESRLQNDTVFPDEIPGVLCH